MTPRETTSTSDQALDTCLDFRVDELTSDEQARTAFHDEIGERDDMLDALAQHHSADYARSFYVLYDRSATYGHQGGPQYIALYLQRDHRNRTLSFEHAQLPLSSMAQSWLIHRGCPPGAIALDPDLGTTPADEATHALERRLMNDGDHYALGWSYTRDLPSDHVTVAVLRALDDGVPSPFRVLVEEVDLDTWTHTLREGGFDTVSDAMTWSRERLTGTAGPLPPVRPKAASVPPASVPQSAATHLPGRTR
ncbi:hypothetical protein J7I94_02155 [Streptomyces sp. ISL-12]|uniref:hypothetical protein n=1 Tax=Streptomyces sp. ISL-12 TaxID=2819177 RepID=UPI001BE89DBD|nr:hypothetical protein [Streptomyces sp. ISL-12]MBT2409374.1 hypothetical protein [Streptomyces sp. ISL-12]